MFLPPGSSTHGSQTHGSQTPCRERGRLRRCLHAFLCAALLLVPSAAYAVEPFEWSHWWLPPDHSEHGHRIDALFIWIFWITTIALVIVQALLVYFLFKYRRKSSEQRKAHFIHGNTRLEMAWTLAPAVILAVLALASKDVWHRYRYNEEPAAQAHQMMVIGEQFQWNIIYPGPDGKVGKYLRFPQPVRPPVSHARFQARPRQGQFRHHRKPARQGDGLQGRPRRD